MSKAWIVSETDNYDGEDKACIVFSDIWGKAMLKGATELDIDLEGITCERKSEYDKYAEKGFVPIKTLVKDGWWFECWHCSKQITSDTRGAFFPAKGVYCSFKCFSLRRIKIKTINKEFEQFKIRVSKWKPGFEIVSFSGGYPILEPSAKFTFPGAKHGGGTLRLRDGEIIGFVANGDMKVYNKLMEEQNAKNKVQTS